MVTDTYRIPTRIAPSIDTLMQIKDVTEEMATLIRHIWHTEHNRLVARQRIDGVINTHGVEYLGHHKRRHLPVWYCNAGDTYATTVVFFGPVMRVACWGDYVERGLVVDKPSPY
jgi:hypothetical protein